MVPSLTDRDSEWLRWMEQLVESSSPPSTGEELSRSQFYCRLDQLPDHLTPAAALRKWEAVQQPHKPLIVNPECRFSLNGAADIDPAWLKDFALPEVLVWVPEAGSQILLPFWLGTKFHHLATELKVGGAAPIGLPSEIQLPLRIAGVLVPEDWNSVQQSKWQDAVARNAEAFSRNGYVSLSNLLHPFQVAALRRYYRCLVRSGKMQCGDHQSARRYVAHNESVARFFHHQLTAAVGALAGEPVKPSYVYVASYEGGAILKKHTDREQCEFSISLLIDYAPEPRNSTPWPLQLHTVAGKTTVFQALGDGLLYRGHQLPHSRDALREGHTSTSIFLHYVRQDFDGPLD